MADILFKRLFEVRILHGYYLDHWFADSANKPGLFQAYRDDADGTGAEKRTFVLENKYNILRDLHIEPTPKTAKLLSGLKMRWRAMPTGFIAGVEVSQPTAGTFFPKTPPPVNSVWSFVLRLRNAHFYNITNHALRPTLPGRYYFSNLNVLDDNGTYCMASLPAAFSANRFWEMGELANFGTPATPIIKIAKKTTNSGTDFEDLPDFKWANTADRQAFPKQFRYRFDASLNVTDATFTLTTPAGEIVKTISRDFSTSPAPAEITLDFSAKDKLPSEEQPQPIPDGRYNLEIAVNGNPFETRSVVLRSDLPYDNSVFGLVDITLQPTTDNSRLLNADGSLNLTPIPNTNPVRYRHPVFEIRLLSRRTAWHYQIEKNAPAADMDFPEAKYTAATRRIVTKTPHRLSLARAPVPLQGNVFLPSPEKADLKYDPVESQFFSELFLSTIKLT